MTTDTSYSHTTPIRETTSRQSTLSDTADTPDSTRLSTSSNPRDFGVDDKDDDGNKAGLSEPMPNA
ncbi:MAG: hypothetical protein AAGJ35_12350, partial [Myxococcota bacterium]